VSDQDFFFDEDEKPAKSQSKSASANKPASSPAKGGSKNAPAAPAQSVTYSIAALIGIAALLLGIIVGILLPINVGGAQTATPDAGLTQTGAVQAPQLTPEQMQNGQLPPGHPSVGGSTGATGSATTTP
jgi:hypothetical protein